MKKEKIMEDDTYRTKLFERIALGIEYLIKDGYLQAGDTLCNERELAEKLGVSRTSLRGALRYLQGKGVIFTKPGKGSIVLTSDADKLEKSFVEAVELSQIISLDLMEVRAVLERYNAYFAAERANKLDIQRMEKILHEQHIALLNDDEEEEEKQDLQFHYAVTRATHNMILVKIFYSIREIMEKNMKKRRIATLKDRKYAKLAYSQHEKIFEAIKKGNPEGASLLMFHHIQTFLELLTL